MDECATPSCSTRGPWWRLPVLLLLVLAGVLLSRSVREATEPSGERKASQSGLDSGETVSLAIDFRDGGRREFDAIAWQDGMTVRDALAVAADSTGDVKLSQQGTGAAAFLTDIDGVENEGGGGRNWTFAVNGKLGDRSFAIYPLRPGDHVLWTFAAQQ